MELAAYFVVSEALTNVAKYASATRATVAVVAGERTPEVEVNDDGVGGAKLDGGTGLRGLATRLESIDGRLDVDSEPGHGTAVRASIPSSSRRIRDAVTSLHGGQIDAEVARAGEPRHMGW